MRDFLKKENIYKVKKIYLEKFAKEFWFIPSDVLQRSIEGNIWDNCIFKPPILDIGIGNGEISTLLFGNIEKIDVGIDIDENGLKNAKLLDKYKNVMCVNAEKMPFKDGTFNTVISNSTFEHIKKDLQAVSEASRILKKNGLFFITVPSIFLQEWILRRERDKNKKIAIKKLNKFNKRLQHFHYRSISDWKRIFQKNNLEVIYYKYYFKKEVALFWYKLFNIFTYNFRNREVWSYLGHSKLTKFLPKTLIIFILKNALLKKAFEKGFLTNSEEGAQLFIVAKKK